MLAVRSPGNSSPYSPALFACVYATALLSRLPCSATRELVGEVATSTAAEIEAAFARLRSAFEAETWSAAEKGREWATALRGLLSQAEVVEELASLMVRRGVVARHAVQIAALVRAMRYAGS